MFELYRNVCGCQLEFQKKIQKKTTNSCRKRSLLIFGTHRFHVSIELGVFVVRAFVNLRRGVIPSQELAAKLPDLEIKLVEHDQKLVSIVQAIKVLKGKKRFLTEDKLGFS